jgi:hypothetical protein
MQHITLTLEDQDYRDVSTKAAQLNLSVDTYLHTLIMKSAGESHAENGSIAKNGKFPFPEVPESIKEEVDRRIKEAGSPGKALIGLFSDIPDVMDAIVADAMAARSEPWRLPNDESTS